MANLIEMHHIYKAYGKGENKVTVLVDVHLEVAEGEFVAILGPSGSGKTTLMNIIGLMDYLDEGTYLLDGLNIPQMKEKSYSDIRGKKIGFVFQKFNLIPQYTALYNVALPLLLQGASYRGAREKAKAMLEKVGLGDRMNHKPNELSGGQMQRVAIARALIGNSPLILADEPTGALDQKTGHEIMGYMKELNQEGKTIVMITHDINIAKEAGRIVRVEDGRIQ